MAKPPNTVARSREAAQIRLSKQRILERAANLDQEARDLANDAIARSEAHENLCTERWEHQKEAMARVETALGQVKACVEDKIGRLPAGLIAGLTGICGYLAARAFPLH